MDAAKVVDLIMDDQIGGSDEKPRYRGVTCKKYGDASRYNAAFSLLGDRFSLGGFDTADQAAAAWDVVAWKAGRDDLNMLKLGAAPPSPSKDDLKRLAKKLRDNMRLRGLNHVQLQRTGLDVDVIDLATKNIIFRAHKKNVPPPVSLGDFPVSAPPTPASEKAPPPQTPTVLENDDEENVPKISDALFSDCFKTSTGAALILHGVVYVVSARLSRRWLVERFDRVSSDETMPLLEEISAADLHRAGTRSFGLLARGLLSDASEYGEATVQSVLHFLTTELVGRTMLDADKKISPAQRERVVTELKVRSDFGVIVALTKPTAGDDAVLEYDLDALRKAIDRFANNNPSLASPQRKKLKVDTPTSGGATTNPVVSLTSSFASGNGLPSLPGI